MKHKRRRGMKPKRGMKAPQRADDLDGTGAMRMGGMRKRRGGGGDQTLRAWTEEGVRMAGYGPKKNQT